MTDGFMTVLRMSATGSIVILAVLLVRLALGKAPKRWSWALWAVVLFRLLTPFGIPVKVPMPDVRLPALFGAETGTEDAALPGYSEPLFDPEERYDRTELFPWYTENRPSSEPSAALPDGGIEFEAAPMPPIRIEASSSLPTIGQYCAFIAVLAFSLICPIISYAPLFDYI